MKIISNFNDLEGKLIKEVVQHGGYLAIRFFGDSCLLLEAERGWDSGDQTIEVLSDEHDLDVYEKRGLGFITQDEFDKVLADQQANDAKRRELSDRARYEELKAKFEGQQQATP